MTTRSALFAILIPAMPEGGARPLTPDQSAAPLAASESFFSVMSHLHRDGVLAPPGAAMTSDNNASLTETPQLPANPPDKAADIDSSLSSTLMGALVQPWGADGGILKPASTRALLINNAPAGSEGEGRPLPETLDPDVSPPETPKTLARLSEKAPQAAVGELGKPASVQAVNFKITPVIQEVNYKNVPAAPRAEARPLTKTSNRNTCSTETPKSPARLSDKAPQAAASEIRKPATTQAVNYKIVPAVQGGETKPSTETSKRDASATEKPKPLANPPGKPAEIEAAVPGTLLVALVQPQAATGEFREPPSTQASNSKNGPVVQGEEATPLTPTSKTVPSSTETPMPLAQASDKTPPSAAGEFHKPASAQAVNYKIAPAVPTAEAKPLRPTSKTVPSSIETPMPLAQASDKTPPSATGEFHKPASAQAVNYKIAPAVPTAGAKPLTPTSKTDPSSTETPMPLAQASDKTPPGATGEFHKPASAQAVNYKIAPAVPTAEAKPLTPTSKTVPSSTETPMPPAQASDKTPPGAAGEFHKPACPQAVNYKIAPAVPTAEAKPLRPTSKTVPSSIETPMPLAQASDKTPPSATGEFHKPASAQAVNYKIAPAVPTAEAKPLTPTSKTDPSSTETPMPLAQASDKTPPSATGEFHKPASTQAVNYKIAPAVPTDEARPLTETSKSDAPATETPKLLANPPGQPADTDALVSSTLVSVPVQPQVAARESGKSSFTQATNIENEPPVRVEEAMPLTETSASDALTTETPKSLAAPTGNVAETDASLSSTLTAVAAQPQIAAAGFREPASAQAVNYNINSEDGVAPSALPSSSDSKPESAGPVQKAIGPHPAEVSASTKESAGRPAEPAGRSQDPVPAQNGVAQPAAFVSAVPVDGTGGALNSQRMKFASEKNEIAGADAQKVPTASLKGAISAKGADDLLVESDSDHSGHKLDSFDSAPVMDWPAKSSEWNVNMSKGTVAAQPVEQSATQAERVGQVLDQQVVMMHQTGANKLAVSLKLDARTELSLQLTNHNGQIQASVRLERGAVPGLDNHWRDLQESLARQNVQLLPMENKAAARSPASYSASNTASASPFNQSSQNPQRRSRETRLDLPPASAVKTASVPSKATTRTVSRQGWESWA